MERNLGRSVSRSLLSLSLGLVLSGCMSGADPQTLIIGDWIQDGAMDISDAGVALTLSNTSTRYLTDGTATSSSLLKIDNVPTALSTYHVRSSGTWRIEGKRLYERTTNATIQPKGNSPQAAIIAQQMEKTITSADESSADIERITSEKMILRETKTGTLIHFKKR